ncbi:MAG: type III pantothenate kinase [Lentisphaerae bacterium]|nr:type III pantothenate kinase [Lentisphaerota bacterium]
MNRFPGTILLVDVGNTSTTLGLARGNRIFGVRRLPGRCRDAAGIRAAVRRTAGRRALAGAVLASVVPEVVPLWTAALHRAAGAAPLVVSHRLKLDVAIDYPKPGTIGPDRLANACGAATRYGAPVIVADFGTALTFDVVNARGAYTGGVIAPGLPLMTDYLAEKTALLPRIRLRGPFESVGKSTVRAMRLGAKIGYRGMVREITAFLERGLEDGPAALCATGGYARWALEDVDRPFRFDPNLTLWGLSRIYDLNRKE